MLLKRAVSPRWFSNTAFFLIKNRHKFCWFLTEWMLLLTQTFFNFTSKCWFTLFDRSIPFWYIRCKLVSTSNIFCFRYFTIVGVLSSNSRFRNMSVFIIINPSHYFPFDSSYNAVLIYRCRRRMPRASTWKATPFSNILALLLNWRQVIFNPLTLVVASSKLLKQKLFLID